MNKTVNTPISNRYDFVYFFEVTDGNPNGDPDFDNMPRTDPETSQGLVTDVCLKRKVRNYVDEVKQEALRYKIYVRDGAALNEQHRLAYTANNLKPESTKLPKDEQKAREITQWMCDNFYDIRTFGAVMTTDVNGGQVRGPIQLTFSRSIDPVVSTSFTITRCAVANKKEDASSDHTMGRKSTVPYGLYRCHGFINASLAERSGFSEDDLELFKESLNSMFEGDRSAARGMMSPVRCIAFRHEKKTGNTRADQLFAKVKAELKPELRAGNRPPRSRHDYVIALEDNLPEGITVEEWVA